MQVILTPQESEKLFLDALCNGLGYIESGYDLELTYDEEQYAKSKKDGDCYEDVLLNILRDGGSLTLKDYAYDGSYTKTISLKDVHEKVSQTPIRHLMDAIGEQGDACTADVILQSVFYGEIIFG